MTPSMKLTKLNNPNEVREISQILSPLVTDLTFSFYFRMVGPVYNIEETEGK